MIELIISYAIYCDITFNKRIYETVIQTVSILNKLDYLKFYFRINI